MNKIDNASWTIGGVQSLTLIILLVKLILDSVWLPATLKAE